MKGCVTVSLFLFLKIYNSLKYLNEMGNYLIPTYPRDYRVDRSKQNFRLSIGILNRLWKIFCTHDITASGYITIEDFLKIIDMPRSSLTDAVEIF